MLMRGETSHIQMSLMPRTPSRPGQGGDAIALKAFFVPVAVTRSPHAQHPRGPALAGLPAGRLGHLRRAHHDASAAATRAPVVRRDVAR